MLFLLLLFTVVKAQNLNNFKVETDYSVDDCLNIENTNLKKYFELDNNNFPICETYSQDQSCNHEKSCESGLICKEDTCIPDLRSCFKYYANIDDNFKEVLWKPSCLDDGSWAPKQCKGGPSGRCFCYDAKGQRIHGEAFVENSANMTCACSRRKSELMSASNDKPYITFHCDNMGNYEELQCYSGHCWCTEPKSGELTSMVVSEKNIIYLPCYVNSKAASSKQYIRKCESQALAQNSIINHLKRHGVKYSNIQMTACRGDGSYGPYIIEATSVYCVSEYNAKSTYQSSVADITSCNCHCAQDLLMYKQMGRPFTLECLNNGNYKSFQSIYTDDVLKFFCVDQDGIKKVDNLAQENEKNCDEYFD